MMWDEEKSALRSRSTSISRGMSRFLIGSPRRPASIAGWLCLLYIVWRYALSVSMDWTDSSTCFPPRYRSSKSITLPKPPNMELLNSTWLQLESSFQSHPPHPESLPKIMMPSGSKMPSVELINNYTDLSLEDATLSRKNHAKVVKALPPYPKKTFSGRGIIMLAGGRYNMYAATALGVIRETGSKLPVEVWMNDTSEEKAGFCDEVAKDGMVCKWLSDYVDVGKIHNGYQLKIMTMMFSSFQKFLFLDADNQPIKNPDTIFDTKSFKDNGAILWPDYWEHTGSPLLPYIVGLAEGRSDMWKGNKTVESGQIVWDKKRHWKALCLAAYYNHYGPNYFYTLVTQGFAGWGDKDIFSLALRALKDKYYMVPFGLNTMFVNGTTRGVGMMQADPANQTGYQPLFLHTNIIKWNPREFMCVGCASDDEDPVKSSELERQDSALYGLLTNHTRIYSKRIPDELGVDPEPLLWRSMEHNVCRGAWATDEDLCKRIREHMSDAFSYQFRTRQVSRVFGEGYEVEEVCLQT